MVQFSSFRTHCLSFDMSGGARRDAAPNLARQPFAKATACPNRAALMKPKLKLQHVEDALRQARGIISTAAKILQAAYGSCTPRTVRNYVKRHPRLVEVIEETVELNLDTAESQLMSLFANGNLEAVIFYLKTKGKARGYVERFEATGSGADRSRLTLKR